MCFHVFKSFISLITSRFTPNCLPSSDAHFQFLNNVFMRITCDSVSLELYRSDHLCAQFLHFDTISRILSRTVQMNKLSTLLFDLLSSLWHTTKFESKSNPRNAHATRRWTFQFILNPESEKIDTTSYQYESFAFRSSHHFVFLVNAFTFPKLDTAYFEYHGISLNTSIIQMLLLSTCIILGKIKEQIYSYDKLGIITLRAININGVNPSI